MTSLKSNAWFGVEPDLDAGLNPPGRGLQAKQALLCSTLLPSCCQSQTCMPASQAQAQRQQETLIAGVVLWHNCNFIFQGTKTLATLQVLTGTLSVTTLVTIRYQEIARRPWAAQYNTWLLIKLTPKGVFCSFLFLFVFLPDVHGVLSLV